MRACRIVPCIYSATVTQSERYHLKQLLNEVRGPTLYQAFLTIKDFVCLTFKSAVVARGLLQDDDECKRCLENTKINCLSG